MGRAGSSPAPGTERESSVKDSPFLRQPVALLWRHATSALGLAGDGIGVQPLQNARRKHLGDVCIGRGGRV